MTKNKNDNSTGSGEIIDFPQREANTNPDYIAYPVSVNGFLESRQVADSRGRSVTLSFKLRPEEAQLLEEMVVEYRAEGYRTVSDVLRHAVRDHTPRLLTHKRLAKRRILDSTWAQLQQMLEEQRHDLQCAAWDKSIGIAEDNISRMQSVGATGEIRNYLARLNVHIKAMHNDFWRNYWSKELHKRWGQYL